LRFNLETDVKIRAASLVSPVQTPQELPVSVRIPIVCAIVVLQAAISWASPKPPKPSWPVANPGFESRDFQPSNDRRLISGVFGPRMKWGNGRYDHHEGFDFFAQYDPASYPRGHHPVMAILPGVVSEVIDPGNPERTETGRKVVITHDVPWTAYGGPREWGQVKSGYLHLTRIDVQQGQRIEAGDPVGLAGETGYTSTVHLHLNVYRAGGRDVAVNPARLFRPKSFPKAVLPLDKRLIEVEWLELNKADRTATARVYLPYNAYTLDGFVFQVGKDTSRAISFEYVSAEQRRERDTGDQDLFQNVRLYPLRYNGGGAIDRVQPRSVNGDWPLASYPVSGGKGVRLGFDVRAYDVDPDEKSFTLIVHGVLGKRVKVKARGFQNVIE
jgi:hypothetical protein